LSENYTFPSEVAKCPDPQNTISRKFGKRLEAFHADEERTNR
jgi:hypothetical protein